MTSITSLIITGDPIPSTARQTVKAVFNSDSTGLMKIAKEMNGDVFAKNPLCYGGAINQGKKEPGCGDRTCEEKDGRGRGVLPDPAGIHEGGRGETAPDQGGDGRDNPPAGSCR